MEIQTKFNNGDEVWYVDSQSRVCNARITKMVINVFGLDHVVFINTDIGDELLEDYAFATKEALKNYILEDV